MKKDVKVNKIVDIIVANAKQLDDLEKSIASIESTDRDKTRNKDSYEINQDDINAIRLDALKNERDIVVGNLQLLESVVGINVLEICQQINNGELSNDDVANRASQLINAIESKLDAVNEMKKEIKDKSLNNNKVYDKDSVDSMIFHKIASMMENNKFTLQIAEATLRVDMHALFKDKLVDTTVKLNKKDPLVTKLYKVLNTKNKDSELMIYELSSTHRARTSDPLKLFGKYSVDDKVIRELPEHEQYDFCNLLANQLRNHLSNLDKEINDLKHKVKDFKESNSNYSKEQYFKDIDRIKRLENDRNVFIENVKSAYDYDITKTISTSKKSVFARFFGLFKRKEKSNFSKEYNGKENIDRIDNVDKNLEVKNKTKSRKAYGLYDEMNSDNQQLYDEIMKKSFTKFLDKLTDKELAYLTQLHVEEAQKIVKEAKLGNKEYSETEVRYIALATKLNNRYKKVFGEKYTKLDNQIVSDNEELVNKLHDKAKVNSGGR